MERLRAFALSIALSLLATGCCTQLRAPHQDQHYSDYDDPGDYDGYDDSVDHRHRTNHREPDGSIAMVPEIVHGCCSRNGDEEGGT